MGEGSFWTLPRLKEALLRVAANKGAAGADEQTLTEFSADAEAQLGLLILQLDQGSYRPGPLAPIPIAKPSGGIRELLVPAVRDRVLQTAVAKHLSEILEPGFSDASHAYRHGRSVASALFRLQTLRDAGLQWVADCDIYRFFDSVDQKRLLEMLYRLPLSPELIVLVQQWLHAEVAEGKDHGPWCVCRGLPQGSPISPVLANLFLTGFDGACEAAGLSIVRYADDFVIACPDEAHAHLALAFAGNELAQLGLALQAEKSGVTSFARGFVFLGTHCAENGALGLATQAGTATEQEAHPSSDSVATSNDDERPPSHDHRPLLRTLYLLENGTHLGMENECFCISRQGQVRLKVPMIRIDQIMVFGNVQMTTPVLHECLERGISVMLLSGRGKFFGIIDPLDARSVPLQRAQFALEENEPRRLALAAHLVSGKVLNCRTLLGRIARARKTDMEAPMTALKSASNAALAAETLPVLRGVEGAAARAYFTALQSVLPDQWAFKGRNRQPPTDPVNALLSYGYTILFYNLLAMIRARGLNTHIGVLHEVRPGHPALVSDLMEEFRAPVVDAVVLHMVLNGKALPGDFSWPEVPGDACLLADGTRQRFIHLLEQKLNTSVSHAGQRLDYRRWMDMQVLQYATAIRNPGQTYVPFAIR